MGCSRSRFRSLPVIVDRDRCAARGRRAPDEQRVRQRERGAAPALARPGGRRAGLRRDRRERARRARRLRHGGLRVRRGSGRRPRRDRGVRRPRRRGVRLGPRGQRRSRARDSARAARSRAARSGSRTAAIGRRLRALAEGVALPFALQGLYLIAYRFASGLGSGRPTTFSYAYLIASLLVAVTATSIALVSSVPLARGDLTPARSARHVVSASWLSLAIVAGAAGVLRARRGADRAVWCSARSYGGSTGTELGRLVAYLVAVDGRLGRALGRLPAPLRARPRALAAAARAGRARACTCSSSGPDAPRSGSPGSPPGWRSRRRGCSSSCSLGLGALRAGRARHPRCRRYLRASSPRRRSPRPGSLVGPLRRRRRSGCVPTPPRSALWRPAGLRAAWGYLRGLE